MGVSQVAKSITFPASVAKFAINNKCQLLELHRLVNFAQMIVSDPQVAKSSSFADVDIGFRCAQDAPEANASLPQADREALVAEFCEVYKGYKADATCP